MQVLDLPLLIEELIVNIIVRIILLTIWKIIVSRGLAPLDFLLFNLEALICRFALNRTTLSIASLLQILIISRDYFFVLARF